MSHERFERLFLSDAPLTPAEAERLRRHLADCPACTEMRARWDAVGATFGSTEMVGPPTGFAARLRARNAAEAVGRGRRQAWRLFGWTSIGATALAAALGLMLLQVPSYLPTVFAGVLQQALRLWLWTRAVGEVTSAFASNVPAPVTAAAVVGGMGLIAVVGLLAALGTFGIIRCSFQGVRP
jgi:anti-sigma factor RsiW